MAEPTSSTPTQDGDSKEVQATLQTKSDTTNPADNAEPSKNKAKAQKQQSKKPQTGEKKAKNPPQAQKKGKDTGDALIGITTKKEEDLADWYQQVLTKGSMLQYSDIPGCYIYEPGSWIIWEIIQEWFNKKIRSIGVKNCQFPLFITEDNLQREKDHIEGFAAEVAWVTEGGKSKLEKRLAVRPTSETAMYGYYSRKIRSHRDLPLRLNQWNNVVRWEFKHPMPFIRSREFLWQEGHTAYLTEEKAGEEVLRILEFYAGIYEQLLAVPVVRGKKTVNEQFPGAHYTTTVEGFIPATGRGIQGGTSHCLGQHFSKMFDIKVEDPTHIKEGDEKKRFLYVWQNSWGFTTRSIGVMILTHGDNKGLVIPPRVAETQVVLIPVGITAKTADEDRDKIYKEAESMAFLLQNLEPEPLRVEVDLRDGYSPGWKFNDWELKGVPLRLEFGPKDQAAHRVSTCRRDNGEKGAIAIDQLTVEVPKLLDTIQADMYAKARDEYDAHRKLVTEWKDFVPQLNAKNVCIVPHCLTGPCEDEIKEMSARKEGGEQEQVDAKAPSMGAKSLCIPFEQPEGLIKGETKCVRPGCDKLAEQWVMFGRSY
jgi:prolyl-tRNA synthetase